jgi:hypothetical protein
MEEAAGTRRAALDFVDDVEPAELRDRIDGWLRQGSMVPGTLTILCADATTDGAGSVSTSETRQDSIARRAAGVQLIYEGLRLTRSLAADDPWTAGDRDRGDIDILVADVLVARGFNLLATTEAAQQAVETVRNFGRDQTVWRTTDDASLDGNLETDVIELAVVAGASLGDTHVSPAFCEFATGLVERSASTTGFAPAEAFFPEGVRDRLGTLVTETAGTGGVTTSVDD